VLLVVALVVTSAFIAWRFQSILYDSAKANVNATMSDIVVASQHSNPYTFSDSTGGALQFFFNSTNLAQWESPSTFIQVDSSSGYPLAKTDNLGGNTIPPNTDLSAKADTAFRDVTIAGTPYLVEDRFISEGNSAAVVHVAQPLDALYQVFAQARRVILFTLAAAAIAVILLSILLAAQATTPINDLSNAMREIGFDRLSLRLKRPPRNDEIGRLAESFNDLLARLEEAFARERRFISDASHELKTPLTSINANAQMLLRWGDQEPVIRHESLETIAAESASLAAMVNGMLTLAKADRGDDVPKEPVSLAQIVSEAVRGSAQRAADKHLALTFEHEAMPVVFGDPSLLRQLVGNLVDNAIKFTEAGSVDVRVGQGENSAWVEVSDSGPGIPEEELLHVFDRFYRTDQARSRSEGVPGTGLGLAIVRSIARVHEGEVTAGRSQAGGALFRVVLPRMNLPLTDIS
jgi:signal transduction histidine kinase